MKSMRKKTMYALSLFLFFSPAPAFSEEGELLDSYYELGFGYGPSYGIPWGGRSEVGLVSSSGLMGGVGASFCGNLESKYGGLGLGLNVGTRFLEFFRIKVEIGYSLVGTFANTVEGQNSIGYGYLGPRLGVDLARLFKMAGMGFFVEVASPLLIHETQTSATLGTLTVGDRLRGVFPEFLNGLRPEVGFAFQGHF